MRFTESLIVNRIHGAAAAISDLAQQAAAIGEMGHLLASTMTSGHKLLAAGNGGSAAEAMHVCEELIGKYRSPRRALPAICLNSDSTALTCIANDWSFQEIFSRQVEALAAPGDLLMLFSTSGNSENLLRAAEAMRQRGGVTLGVLGRDGGKLRRQCNHALVVPSADTGHVQEAHQVLLHLFLECVEAALEASGAQKETRGVEGMPCTEISA